MFEVVVRWMLYAFWIGLFVGPIVLFVLRLIAVLQAKIDHKTTLSVLLTPCSIGYFRAFPMMTPFKKIYFGLATFFFVLTLFGSLFVLYTFFG